MSHSLCLLRVSQVDAAHSKNDPMANMFYHEMKSRGSFNKEFARQRKYSEWEISV